MTKLKTTAQYYYEFCKKSIFFSGGRNNFADNDEIVLARSPEAGGCLMPETWLMRKETRIQNYRGFHVRASRRKQRGQTRTPARNEENSRHGRANTYIFAQLPQTAFVNEPPAKSYCFFSTPSMISVATGLFTADNSLSQIARLKALSIPVSG